MQFNSNVWRGFGSEWPLVASLVAIAVAGCSSVPRSLNFESRSVAHRLGFSGCQVSVPLSPSEVIENSKRSGNPNPEGNPEWIKMAAGIKPGDQVRLVNCLGVTGVGDSYFYALLRNEAIVLKFHPMIFN